MNSPVKTTRAVSPTAVSLDTPVQYLKGVGPRRNSFYDRLGLKTLRDLLYHFPRRHEDRRAFLSISQLEPGQKGTARGVISSVSLFRAKTGTLILQVSVRDSTGLVTALWFNQPYMRKWFSVGQEIILYGAVDRIGRKVQMTVPEFEFIPKEAAGAEHKTLHMGRMVPVYPATSGLHQRELRETAAAALKTLWNSLPDPLPEEIRQRHGLLDFKTAMTRIHFPPAPEAVAGAKDRVTFDEMFCFQLALGMRRKKMQARPGIAHEVAGDLVERWKKRLPFTLTAGQEKAMKEIAADMAAPSPMHRLLQGEVGSGKTVVAAYAMAVAAQSGSQSVVLAPTEVLARQHALTLSQMLSPADISVGLLTSSLEEPARRQMARDLAEGKLQVLVGTHAALEPWVRFSKLGLAVIDEQQKFGVDQRNALISKGNNPDLLILTATPIPRTLSLTLYGEMAVSTLVERPAGRQTARTLWMDSTRREEVFTFVKSELAAGRQAYVVCPRIGGDGSKDQPGEDLFPSIQSAVEKVRAPVRTVSVLQMFAEYQHLFSGYRVGLLHGRMKADEQKKVFAAFKQKEIHLLVATQVIEVGVDVANATVMVIEGAERFGLSQLHQLRGRVGRGEHESTCILIADPKDPAGMERLQTMVQVADGFRIAEEDLRLRGPGELLGKRQSGLPDLKCLEWAVQGPWLELARKEAETMLAAEPELDAPALAPLKREVKLRFPQLIETA
ncbi:MAG: ATP-dependent DNA helicase RecG [Candidatus Omnitrophota bacterium]|nr:ATP-dependent DNA helicase RecG [Candidatus Omnitrophota bacterium]